MRYIIYGAGAVGGVVGGRLYQAGHEVILVCRGAHLDAIQRDGLHLITPEEELRLPVAAVGHAREVQFRVDDAIVLTMKTQDTEAALHEIEGAGGIDLPIICCQNAVENERIAARRFERVYGMCAYIWGFYLQPGLVVSPCTPASAVLDVGCYPSGVDDFATEVAEHFSASHMVSRPKDGIMRGKYAKLLGNLGNAIQAITDEELGSDFHRRLNGRLREEGLACYAAAGVDYAPDEEVQADVRTHFRVVETAGQAIRGSTWQSLARDRSTVETDYLNGEIVLLGRLHGVPTPLNSLMRRLVAQMVARGEKPGRYSSVDLEAMAGAAAPA